MGPMFPRLHVNDTEKGGPRAPPRNKMALYEQLSIPSHIFSHSVIPLNSNSQPVNLEPPSSNQAVANERGMFFSYQIPTRHQSEKLFSQYCDIGIPLTQVKQRKKMDENDFRVPIFVQSLRSQECGKYARELDREKLSPSNTYSINGPLKFNNFKKMGVLESGMIQEGKSQKEENSKEFADRVRALSSSTIKKADGLKKHTNISVCREPRDNPPNSIDRLTTCDVAGPELFSDFQHVMGENIAALDKRSPCDQVKTVRESPSELKILHDLRNDEESLDRSSRSTPMRNMERVDSVSENSVVDSTSRLDITPDDMVGIIGQKHFWKARKAIVNQQRIFAIQVFELHRLVKVQSLVAASPQLLMDDSPSLGKLTKVSPGTKFPLNCPVKANTNLHKRNSESEKLSQKNESSAENTVGKPSSSPIQNSVLPPSCRQLTGNSGGGQNAQPWCFHQPQGHQWLIPVMSPSEGLVYKPYLGPGFTSASCIGCGAPGSNPVIGGFLPPAYGIPAAQPQYHQLPPFPPTGPHGYFPTYGMPVMNTAFSGSSLEQMNPPPIPSQTSAGEANDSIQQPKLSAIPSHKNRSSRDTFNNSHPSKDIEIQASTASSPAERLQDSRGSNTMERTSVLPRFPTAPAADGHNFSPYRPKPERPGQVIKVVPHNTRSATESAARIFRSIQEERKQCDSV